jgi:uncharacterized protein (DUF885 family)
MNKLIALALSGILLASCNTKSSTAGGPKYTGAEITAQSKKVNEYLDRKFDEAIERNPEWASTLGLRSHYGDWTDRSDENARRELDIQRASLDTLRRNFKLDALDEQTKLSVRLVEEEMKRSEDDYKWRFNNYWITQMGGEHDDIPSFLVNVHKIDSLPDAEAYIHRLQTLDKVFDQVMWQLRKREELGVIPPKFTFHYVSGDVKAFMDGCDRADASNVLLTDFNEKIDKLKNIDDAKKNQLKSEAKVAIKDVVKPAYQKLYDYWTALDKKVEKSEGVWSLPDGAAFYQYCLRHNTTTNISPDSIFETGIREVARIKEEMKAIMKTVNYKNDSLQDFFAYMRTDPRFKYSNDDKGRARLLAESTAYLDTVKIVYLTKLFDHIPKAPLVVKAVEKFREKSAVGAFYEDPSEDGSRPGRFYVNCYNMNDEPTYQMEALCYHEGIPGHHMQIALAQELKSVPKFRRHGGNTAYVEGWALYSEKIPKEIGLYKDPYSDFGRLSMEIFRAARLVVDAGIHYKHWSRQQAIDYMLANTANAPGDCVHEVERYFLWPGQATGYKIGMLRILALRTKAQQALGDKFDIRQFHDVVLLNGPVPLNVLEELVDKWINKVKNEGKAS